MQNFGQFYTTYDYHRKYLRKEIRSPRYQKPERYVISNYSTIHKVVHVSFDPPKSTLSEDYISAPRGCWPLKFVHALEIDQGLLAHTTNRVGVPENVKGEHLKLGLKFHIRAPITLA